MKAFRKAALSRAAFLSIRTSSTLTVKGSSW